MNFKEWRECAWGARLHDATQVQLRSAKRWERELGLPVHRPKGADRSAVLAFAEELDSWLQPRLSCVKPDSRGHARLSIVSSASKLKQDVWETMQASSKLREKHIYLPARYSKLRSFLPAIAPEISSARHRRIAA